MDIRATRSTDGVWMARGEYQGKIHFECAYTKKEAIKKVRMWFGDWSVFNGN